MTILLLTFFACGEKETEDTDLDIELNDTEEDTNTEDTDTEDTDTEDTGEMEQGPLEIVGEYEDNWGGAQVITEDTWFSGDMSFEISQYNNELKIVIAQNATSNQYNPDKWSKFQWSMDPHNNLFYCQVAFEEETEDAAISVPPAIANDLETGCGGFSWTMIRESLSIKGSYVDEWSGYHEIDSFKWVMGYEGSAPSAFHLIELHETENYALAQNDISNEWNPNLWSKFEWATDADAENLYYCQSSYDADSIETAAQASADSSDLEAGCNGAPWSPLTEVIE